jgi:1-deoxy-D-xylulose-5-phosphate synthase
VRFLKPLDEDMMHDVFKNHSKVITVEDGTILGGLGSAVQEFMSDNGYNARVIKLGIPDRFIEHGAPEELQAECGFDAEGIYRTIKDLS